jgi:hypothetical protein
MRFAARGPLGVVRPGGFIAMPARTAKTRTPSPDPRPQPLAGQRPRLVVVADRAA